MNSKPVATQIYIGEVFFMNKNLENFVAQFESHAPYMVMGGFYEEWNHGF